MKSKLDVALMDDKQKAIDSEFQEKNKVKSLSSYILHHLLH